MSLLDSLTSGIQDAIGGAVPNVNDAIQGVTGAVGSFDPSQVLQFGEVGQQLMEQLGAGGITQLTEMLGTNFNIGDLLANLQTNQVGDIVQAVQSGGAEQLQNLVGGILGR